MFVFLLVPNRMMLDFRQRALRQVEVTVSGGEVNDGVGEMSRNVRN
jgi:hypothetical protein